MPSKEDLKNLPSITDLLNNPRIIKFLESFGKEAVLRRLREAVSSVRKDMEAGDLPRGREALTELILGSFTEAMLSLGKPSPRRVINGTGIIVHTNLGRAPLPEEAVERIREVAYRYSSLEYDIPGGVRGRRTGECEDLLREICGCEDGFVVNNNAAAVLLVLTVFSRDKQTIVSRGELVEIGGSFRIPEIMAQSGAQLVEVGTTNKTRPEDYRNALTENTALFLKVHRSNFYMEGFVEEPSMKELSALAEAHGIPLMYDMGSGSILDMSSYGFPEERGVRSALRDGAHLVTFSGDKLLGGPQAGIIVGKSEYIEELKTHPLSRALRIDKLNLAALNAVLALYLDQDMAKQSIPVLSMLLSEEKDIKRRAGRVMRKLLRLGGEHFTAHLVKERGECGGGALPGVALNTWCIALTSSGMSPAKIGRKFRNCQVPVIGRISGDRFLIDFRTIFAEEEDILLSQAKAVIEGTVD